MEFLKSVTWTSLGNETLYLLNMIIIKESSLIKQAIDAPLSTWDWVGLKIFLL